jgi:iron complex transport system permease protein
MRRPYFMFSALVVLVLAAFVCRMTVGPSVMSWAGAQLLMEFRLPQALAAALAGSALALSGLQMQTVFQNPLAGPWVLGVVAGSQLGVTLLIISGAAFGLQFTGGLSPVSLSGITTAAAIGGVVALIGALKLARHVSNVTLLLCGLLFSAIADGVRGFLIHLVDIRYELLFLSWDQAGFGGVTWTQLRIFALTALAGLTVAIALSKNLNGLMLGSSYARSLGINVTITRRLSMLSTVFLGGSATAFCGAVLFIDLAVPHLCRGLFRTADHRFLVPSTALLGASMALMADAASGLLQQSEVIPVNIMTCLLGGPVVLAVLLRGERGQVQA